jgi:hypothetical protein
VVAYKNAYKIAEFTVLREDTGTIFLSAPLREQRKRGHGLPITISYISDLGFI